MKIKESVATLTCCHEGEPVSDSEVAELAERIKDSVAANRFVTVFYSTENIFHQVRLLVTRREIPHERIVFRFKGEDFPLDEDGNPARYPDGFIDLSVTQACEMMSERIRRARDGF